MEEKIAVVTGANRGIGLGVSSALAEKTYHVVMVGRNQAHVEAAASALLAKQLKVTPMCADVADTKQIQHLTTAIAEQFSHVDVLINNAGVVESDFSMATPTVANVDPEKVIETFNINTVGALRMIQGLMPLLRKSPAARIVNISSGMGGITEMNGGYPGYRLSKAALNALTKITAEETETTPIKVNSICPGWVQTDMGGAGATRSIDEAIPGILWAAELDADGPSGGFFRDGVALAW